jgi:alanine transaminase
MRTSRHALRRCTALQLRHASGKLSVASLNPSVVNAEYAVRGELVMRAGQIRAQLAEKPGSFPFDKLVECNIGNPQALKQQPISFNRQVLSLLANPAMLDWPEVVSRLPPDVVARAKEYLAAIPQGIGAYSESQGFSIVRQQVADFISARDGVPADAKNIFLTDGASKGVQTLLKAVLRSADDGVLVPIPQYPLYSASLVLDGAQMIGYYLSEANGWEMPIEVSGAMQKGGEEKP